MAVHPDDDAYQKAQNNLLNKFFAEPDTRIKVMHINDFLINSSSGLDTRVEAAMTGLQQVRDLLVAAYRDAEAYLGVFP